MHLEAKYGSLYDKSFYLLNAQISFTFFFTFQETWEPSHIVNVWLPEPLYFHCFDLPCVGALKLLFASLYNLHLGEAG